MQEEGKKNSAENFFQPEDIRFGRDPVLNALSADHSSAGETTGDGMEIFGTADDDAFYEEQIQTRIRDILARPAGYISRTLKAGAFRKYPLNILGRPALPHSAAYLATPDALAHFLSAGADVFAPALGAGVDNIILLPEVVHTDRFLLTHIHAPSERTLLVYLHPMRMNRAKVLDLPERLGPGRRPGLLEELIENLPERIVEMAAGNALHKYVLPLTELNANELFLMDQVQRQYARKFQLDHELI